MCLKCYIKYKMKGVILFNKTINILQSIIFNEITIINQNKYRIVETSNIIKISSTVKINSRCYR